MDFDLSTAILGIAALLFVVALLVLTVWAFKAVFGGG
jgi:flagellar protein FliO/FliZ